MDTARDFDEERIALDDAEDEMTVSDELFDLGGDERRMHVRAYNHWVSLLKSRAYPNIEDLDPARIADFGPHSVLLDFTRGIEDPTIAYLGRTLREECGLESSITRIVDVPSRSLLSRLTDHYLQIIANRAPIGFEAEFVGTRGRTTLYRGILMPYSSDGGGIDFIYGVINWKEVADAETQATLTAELDAAVRTVARPAAVAAGDVTIWADGPSADHPEIATPAPAGTLQDQLATARESAAAVRAADGRGRAALYRALGRAHDFALAADAEPDAYAALLDAAAIKIQPRAPLTPVVKLVFGADYDKTRIAEYAAVLAAGRRAGVLAGELADFLDRAEGGIKAIVAAERAARRPASAPAADLYARAAAELRTLPVLGTLALEAVQDEFVVLLARAGSDGTVDVIKRVEGKSLVDGIVRRAA
ncbi:PAS domain-containing protein [Sphingomonas sp. Tas61C01]|uniref:PAS domain-containing protein n=1 Tax=Sphingomonas sp. Tas61C01 TaxID=3458297 RepID=UPI00403E74BC